MTHAERVDRAEILRHLALIAPPGQVIEVRAVGATSANDSRRPHVIAGYFDDHAKLATAVAGYITQAEGVYITLNEINPALLARACNRLVDGLKPTTSDTDVVRRRILYVDADPVRPAQISATAAEHTLAIARVGQINQYLQQLGAPAPILADSGNGGHALWRIDLPVDDGGLMQRALQVLARRFNDALVKIDETVGNPARIGKLYGTWARKGDSTADRPHRLARMLAAPEHLVELPEAILRELADTLPKTKPARRSTWPGYAPGERHFDLAGWIQRYLPEAGEPSAWTSQTGQGQKWAIACPWDATHTGRCAWIAELGNGAITAGCQHQSCQGHDWHDLRALKEPSYRAQRNGHPVPPRRPPAPQAAPTTQAALEPASATSAAPGVPDSPAAQGETSQQGAPATAPHPRRYSLPADCDLFAYRAEDGGLLDIWNDLHGRDWMYVTGCEAWYAWASTHWAQDETRRLPRQVQNLLDAANRRARERLAEAEQIADAKARGLVADMARAYIAATRRTRNRVASVVSMAENLRAVNTTTLNQGNLLNLSNGSLDLDTFIFREHRKADLLTYCLAYPYDPAASCPRWMKFIEEVLVTEQLQPDPALAQLYQELMGLSLTTDTRLETMVWQEGEGANGKSVATQMLGKLLGPLAVPVNFHTLGQPGNYDLAGLAGRRVVFSTESKRGGKAAEELIRQLVSGEEITARSIYGKPFTLHPILHLWWSMNDRPVISDTSDAIWRRMALIPFYRTFTPVERDTQLLSKLETELSGVLNWALLGLKRLRENGRLTEAAAVTNAVDEYRRESNPIAEWLAARTVPIHETATGAAVLHLDYGGWCKQRGADALNAKRFGTELRRLGVAKKRFTEGFRYACGLVHQGAQVEPAPAAAAGVG